MYLQYCIFLPGTDYCQFLFVLYFDSCPVTYHRLSASVYIQESLCHYHLLMKATVHTYEIDETFQNMLEHVCVCGGGEGKAEA